VGNDSRPTGSIHRAQVASVRGRGRPSWAARSAMSARALARCWQRYTGHISEDETTIKGAWEASADGREWKHDFALTYIKVD